MNNEDQVLQQQEINDGRIPTQYLNEDGDSMDSVLTTVYVKHTAVMKLACIRWKTLDVDVQKSWNSRVAVLNHLPIPSRFSRIPRLVTPDLITNSMHKDSERFVRIIKSAITRQPKKKNLYHGLLFW